MIAENSAGFLLPLYVVYKSKSLWEKSTENGQPGTHYENTQSGWFQTHTFVDWFMPLSSPKLKKIPGKKIALGDNLSSYIIIEVLSHRQQIHCFTAFSSSIAVVADQKWQKKCSEQFNILI